MGMRLSSVRFDSSDVTSERLSPHSHQQQHRRSISPGSSAPRTRSLSHNHQTDEPGSSSARRSARNRTGGHGHSGSHNLPPVVVLDRLLAEIEANDGVISPDDPRIIRLLRAYRAAAETGESGGRARPISVMDAESLLAAAGLDGSSRSHRSRRSGGNRHRSSASTSAGGSTAEEEGIDDRLSAVRRQVLLSLAAASSSSPHRRRQWPESLLLLSGRDRPCIFCKRMIPYDDYDLHYVMCLTRPRVTYNEDILTMDKGECSICLEDMKVGDKIARLPCLCIYHKKCIDKWFQRKQSCPEHPGD